MKFRCPLCHKYVYIVWKHLEEEVKEKALKELEGVK